MARAKAERLLNRGPVLDALGYATVEQHIADVLKRRQQVTREMRTDFDLPTLRVNTDDGYDPGLDSIIAFVTATSRASRSKTPNE